MQALLGEAQVAVALSPNLIKTALPSASTRWRMLADGAIVCSQCSSIYLEVSDLTQWGHERSGHEQDGFKTCLLAKSRS